MSTTTAAAVVVVVVLVVSISSICCCCCNIENTSLHGRMHIQIFLLSCSVFPNHTVGCMRRHVIQGEWAYSADVTCY